MCLAYLLALLQSFTDRYHGITTLHTTLLKPLWFNTINTAEAKHSLVTIQSCCFFHRYSICTVVGGSLNMLNVSKL